jgi:hypothetical protein
MTSSGVTITAQVILNGLCELLTGPSKGMGLTAPRRDAFKLILQCHGGQDFLTTRPEREIEGLLHCLWESAHMELPKQTRAKLKAQAWETYVAFLIMRGSCCAHRTEDERLFYWRQGRWPATRSAPGVSSLIM